jgi:hypothetical protein
LIVEGFVMDTHIAMLGTFCLGAFIGTVVSTGLHLASSNANNFAKVVATVISACFGAAVLQFLEKAPAFGKEWGLAGYCGGLLVAVSWAYMASATANVSSRKFPLVIVGCLHFIGTVAVSSLGLYVFVLPAILDRFKSAP